MNLHTLVDGLFNGKNIPNLEIDQLTEDSRSADDSSVFVCVCGASVDGHDYAPMAYRNGCRVFVAQKPLDLPSDATVLLTDNTRKTLATLACRFYGHPSKSMRLFGITGTKGKTTVAHLITHLCCLSGIPCGYIGTNGIDFGTVHKETKNTTPDAVTLQKTLAEMVKSGMQAAVLEVSSQALAQYRADGIAFETLLFTNLALDHIGTGEHADFEDYQACKKRLFTDFPAKNIVYWADDHHASNIIDSAICTNRIACSCVDPSAACILKKVLPIKENGFHGISFSLRYNDGEFYGTLPLIGNINAQNAALAVTAVNTTFSVPHDTLMEALRIANVPGRSEQYRLPNGATVCIDYAHNAFSLQNLLLSIQAYAPRRLFVLFGSVGGRTQLRRLEMGKVAARFADGAILTSDNPVHESPEQIIEDIAQGFEGTTTPYWKIPDRKTAIRFALEQLLEGDFLVLAGKGHETYQLIRNEKMYFSEKEIVKDYMKQQTKETVFG